VDPTFKLSELVECVQHVVAPHLLQNFLEGNEETLRIHCGDVAFASAAQSIKDRKTYNLVLDPTILHLRGVELQGATRVEDGPPWFIFTFMVQQINCLRDKTNAVVSGAVDDIRDVVYSVALTRHPDLECEGLEYPWIVKELAIVGNAPSW